MENNTEQNETWKEASDKLQHKFNELIDDDVVAFDARHDELLKKLQATHGKTIEEIHQIVFKKE
jgi:hypothetical protein